MGTDIYSESGVLASTDQMMGFITGKNKKAAVEVCQNFYDQCCKALKDDPESGWREAVVEHFQPLDQIPTNVKLDVIRERVASVVKVNGEPGKYDLDTHVAYSDELQGLFAEILETWMNETGKDLPYLESVRAWGSSRYNGYEVPLGEACFVFDKDTCFTKAMSETGKTLKKAIGHCDVSEWTEYSC